MKIFWNKLSNIGVGSYVNEGTRFEIVSANQIAILAFLLTFMGLLVNILMQGITNHHFIILTYSLLYLGVLVLHYAGKNFSARLVLFYNFQWYHLLLGLSYGVDAQAHVIYLVAIVFVFLFFSEEAKWQKILLFSSAFICPFLIFTNDYGLLPINIQIIGQDPPALDTTVFFTSLIFSMLIMYLSFTNLRNLVKKFTRTNIDLLNANGALRAKGQERSDLFAQVIHDLKSPIHSLTGLANLDESEQDEETKLSITEKRNQLLKDLRLKVNEELDRFKDEKYELEVEPLNVKEELGKVLNLVRFYHGFKKVNIDVDIHQKNQILTDRKYFNVIIGNLVSNAIKYADFQKGQPYLQITGSVDDMGAQLQFEDNGIGIAEEKLPHIFNKLYRATDYGEGSGIGLSLVKKAVDTLGGEINIQSQEGRGTKVNFAISNLSHY